VTAILVLAKAPEPGRVKTRLCPPLRPEQAADLAAAALLDTITAAASVPGARPVVVLTGLLRRAARCTELAAALRDVAVLPQRGDGLGERIAAAHRDAAALFPGCPTLQIGMDTPQLDPPRLEAAAAELTRPGVDAVLGPASDGGWWALGLRRPADAGLVAAVPTSRSDTGERTTAALRGAGLAVSLLPELSDVDTAADALAVAAAAPRTRFAVAVAGLPRGVLARGVPVGLSERRPA
jgi:rSAM/selenodomain-associated transferase 1